HHRTLNAAFPAARISPTMPLQQGRIRRRRRMAMAAAISCVTFPVDDLQKSIACYRDGLGLTVEEQDEEHAAFDLDGVYLVLLDRSEFGTYVEKVGFRAAARGSAETIISYFADSRADVDAVMAKAQAAGATISAASDEDGGYSGYFTDPDGHTWEVLLDKEDAHGGDAERKKGPASAAGPLSFVRADGASVERGLAVAARPPEAVDALLGEAHAALGDVGARAHGAVGDALKAVPLAFAERGRAADQRADGEGDAAGRERALLVEVLGAMAKARGGLAEAMGLVLREVRRARSELAG